MALKNEFLISCPEKREILGQHCVHRMRGCSGARTERGQRGQSGGRLGSIHGLEGETKRKERLQFSRGPSTPQLIPCSAGQRLPPPPLGCAGLRASWREQRPVVPVPRRLAPGTASCTAVQWARQGLLGIN